MERDLLFKFCEYQYRLFRIPILIYEKRKVVKRFGAFDVPMQSGQENKILSTFEEFPNKTQMHFLSSLFIDGVVYSDSEDLFVYFGYACCGEINSESVKHFFADEIANKSTISEENFTAMKKYLLYMPKMNPGKFAAVLNTMQLFLNGTSIEDNEIYSEAFPEQVNSDGTKKMLKDEQQATFFKELKEENYLNEQSILFMIRNGMVEDLKKAIEKTKQFNRFDNVSNSYSWRMMKNDIIAQTGIVSRTAMQTGGSISSWISLKDFYMQKIEMCNSPKELNQTHYSMIVDFAQQVFEMKYKSVENEDMRNIVKYIFENLDQKLTLSDISAFAHISKSHLCSKFKQCLGIGLTDFVNVQKIDKAKQLLQFTDKSILEISCDLNFCSQSYFQKIFKELVHLTPTEYRNANIFR